MPKDPTPSPSPVADFEKSLEQAELRVKLLSDPDRPEDAVPFPGTSDDG